MVLLLLSGCFELGFVDLVWSLSVGFGLMFVAYCGVWGEWIGLVINCFRTFSFPRVVLWFFGVWFSFICVFEYDLLLSLFVVCRLVVLCRRLCWLVGCSGVYCGVSLGRLACGVLHRYD